MNSMLFGILLVILGFVLLFLLVFPLVRYNIKHKNDKDDGIYLPKFMVRGWPKNLKK